MGHKAGSCLPAIRVNGQDFNGLNNEIPDWTDQSDRFPQCSLNKGEELDAVDDERYLISSEKHKLGKTRPLRKKPVKPQYCRP